RGRVDPEGGFEPARRHPAPVDGAGHHQGPPHRDRADERPHRAQGRRDRRAGAESCQTDGARDEGRARRIEAIACASGRIKTREPSMDKGAKGKPPAKKPLKDTDETVRLTPEEVAKFRHEDSEQIERAVYDGMQDLRVKKPAPKK